jgi:hypothetical protein
VWSVHGGRGTMGHDQCRAVLLCKWKTDLNCY